MKNIKKILLLTMCTIIGGFSSTAFAAEDFSFDLDAAINSADDATGGTDNAEAVPTGSSAKAIYPTVDAQSYLTATNNMYYDPALIESLIEKYNSKKFSIVGFPLAIIGNWTLAYSYILFGAQNILFSVSVA